MSTASALKAAQALIHNESRWCQGGFAKNGGGGLVDPTDPYARSWCAAGAVMHVTRTNWDEAHLLGTAFDCMARAVSTEVCSDVDTMIGVISKVNEPVAAPSDSQRRRAFKQVHRMFDRAIQLAEVQ